MKAIVIHRHGGPDVLRYESVPTPQPGPGEVVIRLHAIGVNHMEIDVREGRAKLPFPLPHVMGGEGAGEIVAAGPDVTSHAVGDRVMPAPSLSRGSCRHPRCNCLRGRDNLCHDFAKLGITCWGTYAEFVKVAPHDLVRLPDALSFRGAAAGRTAFSTAWELAIVKGQLRPGETVLVNGAGGGVGTAAVAVARHAGARVIGTVGSDDKAERLRALGIDAVVNYRRQDMAAEVMRLTDGYGADLAVETVGGSVLQSTIDSMALGGRIAIAGAHAGETVAIDIVKLFRREILIATAHSYPKSTTATVFDLLARGTFQPVVAAELPLAAAGEAQLLLERRAAFGKVILRPEGVAG